MLDIQDYLTEDGHDPYAHWLAGLADAPSKGACAGACEPHGRWQVVTNASSKPTLNAHWQTGKTGNKEGYANEAHTNKRQPPAR